MSETYNFPHALEYDQVVSKPALGTWIRHLVFLTITFCTSTLAGTQPPFGPGIDFYPANLTLWDDPATLTSWIPTLYSLYVINVIYEVLTNSSLLFTGLMFSIPLMLVLISHEMGHYIACRIYRVDATLPYFIPTPPMIGPAGTFGAFIRIRSRIPTRRAVFDIGVAGPIAGFIVVLPVAVLAVLTMQPVELDGPLPEGLIVFGDPLLIKGLMLAMGQNAELIATNPFYGATWMGALVTALNLIPSGQLDGGHAMYAALGERIHYWFGRIAFVGMSALAILGMVIYQSPAGFLFAIVLGVMMRIPHPQPWDNTPLDYKRKLVFFLTVLIFIVCFVPFPIQIT